MSKKRIDVAVAVVFRSDGCVLWACRPDGKPYAGYWEFPGGKVEAGETVWQALVRELQEELGITALKGGSWFVVEHDYEHANVRLHLYRVTQFEGVPQALEGQVLRWDLLRPASLEPILPATQPLLQKLNQPNLMVLTNYGNGFAKFTSQLEKRLAINPDAWIVQFREKKLSGQSLVQAYLHCLRCCQQNGTLLVVNSHTYLSLVLESKKNSSFQFAQDTRVGVHLTQQHLLEGFECKSRILGASVHDQESLEKAFELNLDYAVLGSVHETASHPDQNGLGWQRFQALAQHTKLPVFAIGGLGLDDLDEAFTHGSHGIAMISRF